MSQLAALGVNHDIKTSFKQKWLKPILHLSAFVVCAFFSYLIPKKKNKVTFFCNESGLFGGNIKPIFLHANRISENFDIRLLSFKKKNVHEVEELGYKAHPYPSLLGFWTFLRSESVVIEVGLRTEICGLVMNSKVFQIWHGANLKYMVKLWDEGTCFEKRHFIEKCNVYIRKNIPKYEFIVSPSEFYKENTFSKSFNSKGVIVAGYPRNDLFFRDTREEDWISSENRIIKKAIEHRQNGGKVIIYAPTWRDTASSNENVNPFSEQIINFLEKNNIYFVVKKHHRDPRVVYEKHHSLIDTYGANKDVYLLMKNSDLMISDYSSIYFDYLLLNKPVVFYPYDLDVYMSRDRMFQYDYEGFTPGKKCQNEVELYEEILQALKENSYYQNERSLIKDLAFGSNPCRNSSKAIWNKILEHQGRRE